jgi:alpha-tubulin suppressor-like RCC1 family protein
MGDVVPVVWTGKGLVMKCRYAIAALALAVPVVLGAGGSAGAATSGSTAYRFGVPGSNGAVTAMESTTPVAVAGISGKIVQIATSNSDGYALTSDGAVWAWGVDNYGELGNGTVSPYSAQAVRVSFPAGVRITALPNPMPFDGGLAIDSGGHAWGWGLDLSGDLCLPGLVKLRPERLPLSGVTLATGARGHTLFYSRGKVYACGSGQDGALGDGSTASSSKPAAVTGLPAGVRVTALTSSWNGSGAQLSNGDYYDWGYNAAGQLGDGQTVSTDVPVKVNLPAAVRQVSQGGSGAGNGQTIAILAGGSVWVWGANKTGQLGNGTTASSDVPEPFHVPAGVTFVAVDSGGYACYAIDQRGQLWSWGGNDYGQLGTGSSASFDATPADVGLDLTQVSSTARNVAGFQAAAGS